MLPFYFYLADNMEVIINNVFCYINIINPNCPMASLNQLISEIAHAAGSPNTLAVRRNIRQAIIHTRNELIRQSYERHGYTDKGLEQRFRLELIDVPDGDVYGSKELNLPLIKRTKNKVPRPVRLINNTPFQSIRTSGLYNLSIPFVREHAAQFYNQLVGLCRILRYDYINEYLYIYSNCNDIIDNINYITVESPFEYPHLIKEETSDTAGEYHNSDYDDSEELDDNEFLLPEDMIGQIKDIIFKRNLLNVAREGNETPTENLTR